MQKASLKSELHTLVVANIEKRILVSQQAIESVQQSANEETKSSAGDKYETGRAMAQLEIEKNGVQLAEARNSKRIMEQINPLLETSTIQSGSIVITDQGNYFISVAAGVIDAGGLQWFAVSPASPIAKSMWGQKAGGQFTFNKKDYGIKSVQ